MNDFVFVCNEKDLEEKVCKKIVIDEIDVVVFRKDNIIYALNNNCTHHHVSVMDRGDFEGDYLLCPNHFWKFDIKSGKKNGNMKGLDKYDVKIEDNKVFVKVHKTELNW